MKLPKTWIAVIALLCGLSIGGPAMADEMRQGGKLLLTDGVTSVEGASGGGLATWATIAGSETKDGIGGSVHATMVALPDFDLKSYGGSIGIKDRLELSYAHQNFDTRKAGAALGLGRNFIFAQDVFGAKVRLVGDAVYDQDRILPQISVGVQYKVASQPAIIAAVGGKQSKGVDFYVSATKVILSRSLVAGVTVRFTKANQFGLLGFGGDRSNAYKPQFEGSLGVLLKRNLLVGGEVRTKPNNLGFAREQKAYSLFGAVALGKRVTFTAAYVDLGDIATVRRQRGAFLSLRGRF